MRKKREMAFLNRMSAFNNTPEKIAARVAQQQNAASAADSFSSAQVDSNKRKINSIKSMQGPLAGMGINYLNTDTFPGLPDSAYIAGQNTGEAIGDVAGGLYDIAGKVTPPVLDFFADTVEGAGNFALGALDRPEMAEGKRFRKGDDFNPFNYKGILGIGQDSRNIPNGGALNSEMPNGGQADLGAGVLRSEATHTMPDGTVMPGATHEEYEKSNASTTETAVEEVVKESVDPVTTIAETPTTKKAKTLQNIGDAANVDRSGTATGNKRDQTRMAIPRIGMAEKLMRIGGAITGASTQGLSAAMAAGSGAYGQLQDEERRLAQVEQQNQMSMLNKLQTMNKKTAQQEKQETEDRELFVSTKAMSTRQSFLADRLRQEGDEVTGFFDGTLKSIYDNAVGNPRSELRLALEQEVVNNTLVSIAQTKGAISNREMELFMKPIPRIGKNQEATWIAWLEMQSALNAIKAKRLDPSNLNLDGSLKSRVQADAEASAELEQLYQNLLDTGYNPFGSGQSEPNEADSVADKYL
jgi:hypothetical protein